MTQQESNVLHESLKSLRHHHLWPKKGHSFNTFRHFLICVVCAPFWICLLLHFIVVLKDNLDVNLSGDISVLASIIGLYFMQFTFIAVQKSTESLYHRLGIFEKFGMPDNFDKRDQQLNFYSKLYQYYVIVAITCYALLKKTEIPQCRRMNEEKDLQEVCGLFTPVWTPFNIDFFPAKQMVFLLQAYAVWMIMKGGAAISFTTFEVSEYIVLRIKHLNRLLKEAFDDPKDEIKRQRIKHCIQYHSHIIEMYQLFDKCYKHCNGSYILMVAIIIAGLANQYMKEKNFGALFHLVGWLISFYVCCYAGESLMSESLTIPDAAFASKWYEAPIDLQRDLQILILRSQRPLYLHATPLGTMSLSLYVAMIKTSYSYFTLLNQST